MAGLFYHKIQKLFWLLSFLVFVLSGEDNDPALNEELFIKKFGDDPRTFETWEMMRQWYYKGGTEALRKFCQMAHKEAGMGEVTVRSMKTFPRSLNFRTNKILSVRIDVVQYEIEASGVDNQTEYPFFLTRGLKPDCAFYLEQWKSDPYLFYLTKHVCGIHVR